MMKKFFQKKIELSKSAASGALALFLFSCYNLFIGANFYFLEKSFDFFVVFLLFFLASFNRKILYIALVLVGGLYGFEAYVLNQYNVIIDQVVIANLLDNISNISEVFIFKTALLYFTVFILIPVFLLNKIAIKKENNRLAWILVISMFIIFSIVLSLKNHIIRKGIILSNPPISTINALYKYYEEIYFLKNRKKLTAINELLKVKINKNKIEDLKVVLIIGESARSKNFAINGYQKDTTPKIIQVKNLISFKDVEPCSNLTRYSVACMLSYKGEKNFSFPLQEESIIKIFANLNFSTSWFSTQKAVGDDNILLQLASESQNFYFADHIAKKIGGKMIYDEYLLEDLKQSISKPNDDFIVLHMQGSHFLFHERYDVSFAKFLPFCQKKNLKECDVKEIENAYDNTILYTDYFINSVIEELKNKNALLIYVSDHGQFLGEKGVFYHGATDSKNNAEHRVPMFLWMSDSLMKNNFYKNKFIHAKAKINKNLSHDNLFYSLLDCAGLEVDSSSVKERSLCR